MASFLSCTGQNNLSKDEVVLLMDEYFEKVKKNDFSLIETYYSEAFYESTGKENWEELYNKVHSILGPLNSTELESWNMRSFVGTSGSGTYYTLIYNNKYENGIVIETINIFSPRGEKKMFINGHNYNSDAFLGN
jgi:hypothetical protein